MKDSRTAKKRKVLQIKQQKNTRSLKPLWEGIRLVLLPVLLFLVFLVLYRIHISLTQEISRQDLSAFTEASPLSPYPVLIHTYIPTISAQSAVVMDNDSKVFLYAKNPRVRFSMASTTKLMTALIALEQFRLDDELQIYRSNVEGSVVGLLPGERYTVESLLYAMLLPSANDAAAAIADNYPGGEEAFIKRMNEKAAELHLTETQYDDPAGLEDDANYTTAVELAYLASIAFENDMIAEITGTKTKVITDSTGAHVIPLENLNVLLGTNGVVGIKTGFTQGAGGVLTTAKKEKEHLLIIVVMRSLDRFADTRQLLSLVTGNVRYQFPTFTGLSISEEKITQ